MKIAIIGLGDTKKDAPYDDPEWVKYGLPWDDKWESYQRLFEMHSDHVVNISLAMFHDEYWDGEKIKVISHRPQEYGEILQSITKNPEQKLYMHEEYMKGVTPYPFKPINADIGHDYYISSVSYMLAMAIHEISVRLGNADEEHEIGIWGVDICVDGEWVYQRANNEFFIGLAQGRGIKVTLPAGSMLMKFVPMPVRFGAVEIVYHERYGILGPEEQHFKRIESPEER
jgi:hypothetical protein|tara:strand:- start:122 stop:805 length:684 start_codon:yes stop_codon:yes gene_type:complete